MEQTPGLPIANGTSDTHGEEMSQRRRLPLLDLGKDRVTHSRPEAFPFPWE